MLIYCSICLISVLLSSNIFKYAKDSDRNTRVKMVVSSMPLILVSALRYGIGTDYFGYLSMFNNIKIGRSVRCEYLFRELASLIIKLGGSYRTLVAVVSLITLLFLFLEIFRDSPYIGLSIFLIFGTYFYFVSMNQIRFTLGASVLVYAIRYVEQRRFLSFTLFVLIAGGFHSICYTFFIVYFLYNKLIARRTIVISSILLFVFRNPIENVARIIMGYTRYASYLGSQMDTRLTPVVYLFIQTAIMIFLTLFFSNNPKYVTYYNIEVVNYWITLCLGRLPEVERFRWVYGLSLVISIPLAISNIHDAKWRMLARIGVVILYGVYAYYLLANDIGMHTPLPYRSIFEI